MLLEDKINSILLGEPEYISKSSDILIDELELRGLINTKTATIIDVLYYLLNLDFPHNNINLELYKRLTHLLDLNIGIDTSNNVNYVEPIIVPTIVTSTQNLNFGVLRIGDEKVLSFTFEASATFNSIIVSTNPEFLISNDPINGFTTELLYLPTAITGSLTTTTVYVKYIPVNIGADTTVLNIDITGVSTTTVNLTGEGVNSTLFVAPNSLSFGATSINTSSIPQFITISGTDLESNVTILAPNTFQLSTNQVNWYTNIVLTPTSGVVSNTILYVKFVPDGVANYSNNISAASTSATTLNIVATGVGFISNINTDVPSLTFGNITLTYDSGEGDDFFHLGGDTLTGDVTLTASSGYTLSVNNAIGPYTSSAIITPTLGVVDDTIYVLFSPTLEQSYSGSVIIENDFINPISVSLSGNGVVAILARTPSTLSFPDTEITQESVDSFDLSGGYLMQDVVVTAPTGFQVSKTLVGGYNTSISYNPSLINTGVTVYVKFIPQLVQSYSGNIVCTSTPDAVPVSVAVDGEGISAGTFVEIVSLDSTGSVLVPITTLGIQKFINTTAAFKLVTLYVGFGGSSLHTIKIGVKDDVTNTLLWNETVYAGTNAGGLKDISPPIPVTISTNQVIRVEFTPVIGNSWFLNLSSSVYAYNAVADSVPQIHPTFLYADGLM